MGKPRRLRRRRGNPPKLMPVLPQERSYVKRLAFLAKSEAEVAIFHPGVFSIGRGEDYLEIDWRVLHALEYRDSRRGAHPLSEYNRKQFENETDELILGLVEFLETGT